MPYFIPNKKNIRNHSNFAGCDTQNERVWGKNNKRLPVNCRTAESLRFCPLTGCYGTTFFKIESQ